VSSPMHGAGPGIARSMSADPRAAGGVSVPIRQAQGQHVPPPASQSHPRGQPQLAPLHTGQGYRSAQGGPRSADPYARDPRYTQQQAGPYSAGGMGPPGGQPAYPQGVRSPQVHQQQLPPGAARPMPSQQHYGPPSQHQRPQAPPAQSRGRF
jgi:hypothetical protein